VAVQLFVAAFSSFLVVGLVAMYSPAAAGGAVTVDVGVSGNASGAVAPVVDDDPARDAAVYENRTAALAAFDAGRVDAVLHASALPPGNLSVAAYAPDGEFRTTLVVVQLKDALADLERARRSAMADRLTEQPLGIPDDAGGNPYLGFTYAVLVPLLVLLPVFVSGSVAADSVAEELERGTVELLRATPLSTAAVLDGKALAAGALAPVQVVAWLALLGANGTPAAHPLAVVALSAGLALLAVGLGAGLACWTGERRSAQLLYSMAVLVAVGAGTLLPEGPANAVAKLALGTPSPATWAVVALAVIGGAGTYAVARGLGARSLARDGPNA